MANFIVTTGSSDEEAGLTLAEAIAAANDSAEADTIGFADGVDSVVLAATLVARSGGGELTISGDRDDDGITDVALQAGSFAHLFVQSDTSVTIRNVDFLGGYDQRSFVSAEDGTSGRNASGTTPEEMDGIDGGDAGPAQAGGEGTSGADGADAASAIQNFGDLTLERVGFGGGRAQGQSAGTGGDGGFGGFSRGGDGLADTTTADSPSPSIFGPLDSQIETTNTQTEPFAGNGGTGGEGGSGGQGGTGGEGGTGSAILNHTGATLTLTDVTFGGRLSSGTLVTPGFFSGGWGGDGGTGGSGGRSAGGNGANGGQEWGSFEIFEFIREDGTVNDRFAYLRIATSEGGRGGDAGEAGSGGAGGVGGDAGSAGFIVNEGTIDGRFAGAPEDASLQAGRVGEGGDGGDPGEAVAGVGGFDRLPWNVRHASSILGNDLFTPEHRAYRDLIVELGSNNRSEFGDRAESGSPGIPGSPGGSGPTGTPGLEEALVNEGSGDADVAGSLVYLYGGGAVEEGDVLTFSMIRTGDVGTASTVTWRVVPGDSTAADFGGSLPGGTVQFDAVAEDPAPGETAIDGSNARRISIDIAADGLAEAREDWRVEIVSATGGTVLGTSVIDAWTVASEGEVPSPDGEGRDEEGRFIGTSGADRFEGSPEDDTYVFNVPGDRVIEAAGDGVDTIVATASVTLGRAEIERVVLEGAGGGRVTGNSFRTEIEGNAGSNVLIGGGGGDVLTGGGGQDFFAFLTSDAPGAARITDFGGADQIALDDRFFGLGDGQIDVREVTGQQVAGAVRNGLAGFDRETSALWVDQDGSRGPMEREVIAILDEVTRIGADDLLLF